MRILLKLWTVPNNLKKGFTVFLLLGASILIGMAWYAEAQVAFTSGDWTPGTNIYWVTTDGKHIRQLTDHE